jgi:mercuric ion binding protein
MNKLLTIAAGAFAALAPATAIAAEQTVRLSVPGMTCASCPYIVKQAIASVDGIRSVTATMDDLSTTVTFEDTLTSVAAIRQATADIGYPSSLIEAESGS